VISSALPGRDAVDLDGSDHGYSPLCTVAALSSNGRRAPRVMHQRMRSSLGSHGGNLVLREFIVGAYLFLPVMKSGARLWLRDILAAQGDGVVDQTGIETAAEDLKLRLDLHEQPRLSAPLLETDEAWIIPGFGDSLDDVLVASLRQTIKWLSAAAGTSESEVYALCSMGASFRVTQYAHQTGTPCHVRLFTRSFQRRFFPTRSPSGLAYGCAHKNLEYVEPS
jgi:acetamidase/formamidase